MFDFETTLSGIEYKVRQLIEDNNRLKDKVLELTEANEELNEYIKNKDNKIKELIEQNQSVDS